MANLTSRDQETWISFFGEAYVRFSQYILTPERTGVEVVGIQRLLRLAPGARILDLGCGQGRIAIPLAKAGYRVVGLDRSSVLLRHARRAAEEAGVSVTFVEGDARDMTFDAEFDAVINVGTALGYVADEADDARMLNRAARSLKPGGVLLIEADNRDRKVRMLLPRTWERMGDVIVRSEASFDPVTGRWHNELCWQEAGREHRAVLDFRVYAPSELRRMVTDAGLAVQALYGGWNDEPLTLDSPRLVLLATRLEHGAGPDRARIPAHRGGAELALYELPLPFSPPELHIHP